MLLGESEVPGEDSAKLKHAHALLRLAEVTRLQAALERAVGEYAVLRGARRAAGAAGKDSRSLQRKRKARSKKVRNILAELGVWRQVPDLPQVAGDHVVMCLPQAGWEDDAMQRLYEGVFPWREGEGGVALAVLAEKYRDAKAEVGGAWGRRGFPCMRVCFAASPFAPPSVPVLAAGPHRRGDHPATVGARADKALYGSHAGEVGKRSRCQACCGRNQPGKCRACRH
jgi:hypothetical protein